MTPLHVDEPAPAALVGVDFFFFFLCGRTRAACSAIPAPCLFFFWPMANRYAIAETQRDASAERWRVTRAPNTRAVISAAERQAAGSSPLNVAWKRAALLRIAAIKQREETPKTSSHENQPEPNQDRRQEPKQTRQYVSSCVQIIRAGSYLATSAAVERPALLEIASSTRLWLVFFIWSSV